MKIYIVLEVWYTSKYIRNCFSTKEKAEEYIKNCGRAVINFEIEEWEVQ